MVATLTRQTEHRTIEDLLQEQIDSGSSGNGSDAQLLETEMAQQQAPIRDAVSLRKSIPAIDKLRELTEGWDGRDADPPSESLLSHAEALWRAIDDTLSREFLRPTVRMCRDGYISFSWIVPEPRKELHVWIHDDEPITYELHLRTPAGPVDNEQANVADLFSAVGKFFRS